MSPHTAWFIPEIYAHIFELLEDTLGSRPQLAACTRILFEPASRALWKHLPGLWPRLPLFSCLRAELSDDSEWCDLLSDHATGLVYVS